MMKGHPSDKSAERVILYYKELNISGKEGHEGNQTSVSFFYLGILTNNKGLQNHTLPIGTLFVSFCYSTALTFL